MFRQIRAENREEADHVACKPRTRRTNRCRDHRTGGVLSRQKYQPLHRLRLHLVQQERHPCRNTIRHHFDLYLARRTRRSCQTKGPASETRNTRKDHLDRHEQLVAFEDVKSHPARGSFWRPRQWSEDSQISCVHRDRCSDLRCPQGKHDREVVNPGRDRQALQGSNLDMTHAGVGRTRQAFPTPEYF